MHQSFERKKKRKKLYRGRVGTLNFFCGISLTRSSRKPSVKFSLSSESSLQKVLEYRRRRQSIQSGLTAFVSKHDELSADKKIQSDPSRSTLGTFGPNKLENCKKLQETERLGPPR